MISLLLTACLASASTTGKVTLQSQARLPNATYQYRCVEDKTMGWTFLFLRAQGCALAGSGISITTKNGVVSNYDLHELDTCTFGTKLFLGNEKCSSIYDLSLTNILTENQ